VTLLNQVLAFGAAAFAIPLLIHLLNRSRFRTLPWGAMHLLESVLRVNTKRIRVEQWILLLVRCAIPILLAFCLARPVLTGWRALPGDAPTATVILLDNSYSMDAAGEGRDHFQEAVEQACEILGARAAGSEVSVVTTGGLPTPLLDSPVFDPRTMVRRLRALRGGKGAAATVDSFEYALAVLAGMTNARRDLIWISDFQRADWESLPASRLDEMGRRLESQPIRPVVTFVQVGREVENNLSIDSLEFPRGALGTGQVFPLRATLRNRGPRAYEAPRVLFRVDGVQHAVAEVAIAPNATAQALFAHTFKDAGSHVVEVEVEVDDQLATDNRHAAAVTVLEQIPVLLVDGAPSSEPMESETDFLAVALTPFTFGRTTLADLIQTQTVPVGGLDRVAVAAKSVVVLANVARMSDDQLTLVGEYVRGGGGLLVFAGNKTDIAWYNQSLSADNGGLLPMSILGLGGQAADNNSSTRVLARHFEHPALELFNDRANGNLGDAEIRTWYRLGRAPTADAPAPSADAGDEGGRDAVVLARLETGDPLIVERRLGDGLVVQVAISCDADWSNLPMRPAYLPLMQQLVTTMASRVTPPSNVRTGEPLVAIFRAVGDCGPLVLTTPDGTQHTVRPASRGLRSVVEYGATQQPGVYTLFGPDARPRHFVAEAPRNESDLRRLDARALESLAARWDADLVHASAEYLALDSQRRHGREIWRILFAATLGLLFLELVLQQRFSRVRV